MVDILLSWPLKVDYNIFSLLDFLKLKIEDSGASILSVSLENISDIPTLVREYLMLEQAVCRVQDIC